MKPNKTIAFTGILLLATAVASSAATLVGYDFTGNVITPTTGPLMGVSATSFLSGSGYGASNFDSEKRRILNATGGSTEADARVNADAGNKYTLTVTADMGGVIDLTGFTLTAGRGGGDSALAVTLFLTPDGGTSSGTRFRVGGNGNLGSNTPVGSGNLASNAALQGLDAVTAEIVFHSTSGSGGNNTVDNVVFAGEVVPVPEPSSALLGALGLVGLLRRRRS